jgi:hypothetical protein
VKKMIPQAVIGGVIGAVETIAKRRDKFAEFRPVERQREKEFKEAEEDILENIVWEQRISELTYYSRQEQTVTCFDLDEKTIVCFIEKRIPEN